jgi:hypothetical protein
LTITNSFVYLAPRAGALLSFKPVRLRSVSVSSSDSDFLAAYESACSRLFSQIDRSCAVEEPWPARVRRAIVAALTLFAADPSLASTLLYQVDAAGPEAQLRHEETLTRLTAMLRQGREEIDAPPLPDHIEEGLIGGLLFLVGRTLRSGKAASLPGLAPDLTTMLLTPYLGQGEAERLAHESA